MKYYQTNKPPTCPRKSKSMGNILYLNCGGTFTDIYNCQNSSNYILKLNGVHCM